MSKAKTKCLVVGGQWLVEDKSTADSCPAPSPTTNHQSPTTSSRRGVLLLVVLSLLVLFSLVAVTFVLVAGRYYDAARNQIKVEQTGDNPAQLLDEVLAQCVRGSTNPNSVIGPHGLLEDLYGNDGIKFKSDTPLGVAAVTTNGQLLDFTFTPTPAPDPAMPTSLATHIKYSAFPDVSVWKSENTAYPQSFVLSEVRLQTPGFYNGCVLTALGGAADGKSTRIVGWGFSGTTYTVRVLAFDNVTFAQLQASAPTGILVNGRPFNGTGFGFNPAAPTTADTLLNAELQVAGKTLPFAWLPNPIFANPQDLSKFPTSLSAAIAGGTTYTQFGGIGGADEDYDAADTQNMLLAYMPVTPNPGGGAGAMIPSLHRPDTIVHAINTVKGLGALPPQTQMAWERALMLRPHSAQFNPNNATHPLFPSFDLTSSVFDVDNDGDGIRDSVWVDAGLPVRTGADGRTYKPLVAIMCLDMDGRLNVNAHGTIAHVDSYYLGSPIPAIAPGVSGIQATQFTGGNVPELSRGQGYGPAEISLYPLFTPPLTPNAPTTVVPNYARLLNERYSEPNTNLFQWARDRNSSYTLMPYTSDPAATPGAGQKRPSFPGATAFGDRMANLNFTHFPNPLGGNLNSFASPADLWGRGFVVRDLAGIPVKPYMGHLADRTDSPYELNLSRKATRASDSNVAPGTPSGEATPNPLDSPFSAAEFERILRMYDLDASQLPDRLRALLDGAGGPALAQLRQIITTDSFDLPTPPVLPTRDMRQQKGANPLISPSLADLLRVRLNGAGYSGGLTINEEIARMLPPEVVAGKRMDINRPFGNGLDDDSDNIVDEPMETETAIWNTTTMTVPLRYTNTAIAPNLTNGVDVNRDGAVDAFDSKLARQLYAQHLYILMMLLKDRNCQIDYNGDGFAGTAADEIETAYAIAQWAINVVDYRDRDSIMSSFEFNTQPFVHGWTADGILTGTQPNTGVVWGCERPELLITETLAFHDRRTEDLNSDPSGHSTQEPPADKDNDFDQRLAPRGSLFIELYNPWVTQKSVTNTTGKPSAFEESGEFYDINVPGDAATGVMLNRLTPGNSPVWRMIIVKGDAVDAGKPKDLDHPDPAKRPTVTEIERSVYFARPLASPPANDGQRYFQTHNVAPLLPGRYAVVGSAGVASGGKYITTIGRTSGNNPTGGQDDTARDGAAASTTTRQISLQPSTDTTISQVAVLNNGTTEPAPPTILPPIAIVIDQALDGATANPRSVSISEPTLGYPGVSVNGVGESVVPKSDLPLDDAINPLVNSLQSRVIHLQRLADPTMPFNPSTNPYRTIDTAPVALTVFSGVMPGEPAGTSVTGTAHKGLASTQRGMNETNSINTLWTYGGPIGGPLLDINATMTPGDTTHNYPFQLKHTLGYLNDNYYPVGGIAAGVFAGGGTTPGYGGQPKNPFPWLTWNNRPYVGPLEMMLVPKCRSSRLSMEYMPPSLTPYNTPPTTNPGHLLPFFQTVPAAGQPLPNLQRVFDYLEAPSRFVGTDIELDPQQMAGLPAYDTTKKEQLLMSYLHPPFNRVSNYRDPGRININTIASDFDTDPSSMIWNGVLNQSPTDAVGPTWNLVAQSRQGAAAFSTNTTPTRFTNPFRSSAGSSLMMSGINNATDRQDVDVTVLRSETPESNNAAAVLPLFKYNTPGVLQTDTTRNPYFRTKNLQRLNNLVTTRSNVYAIWITVGYFEVRPPVLTGPPTPRMAEWYPDGYELMQEMGSDTGEVVRHRAFYIYDRSIPVGFERGKDHNFADGLLLKRFIE